MTNIPRPEYPRPQMVRPDWQNLNGKWQFEFDHGNSGKWRDLHKADAGKFDLTINVPFVPQSKLSGIEHLDFFTCCWYRRKFTPDKSWCIKDGRILLHFGAVDFVAEVWVNEKLVGMHRGGYTPFVFDITDSVTDGENLLVVRAYDDGHDKMQYTGKQIYFHYDNKACWYPRCNGIWQTVWLEYVPNTYIKQLKMTPDVDNEKLDVTVTLNKWSSGAIVNATVTTPTGEVTVGAKATGSACTFSIPVPKPRLWSLDDPYLYDVTFTVGKDSVVSYFGMRKVEIVGYAVHLNDKPVYQRLVLDQGFYRDGIITAPSDDVLRRDVELGLEAGFNGARLHMKVFEPGTLYWADKLGYLVWGEFPNWGMEEGDPASLNSMLPGWIESVNRDYNSPALVGWCPFNETRPNRVAEVFETFYDVTRAIDPIRPIIDTSGYVHSSKTDIFDVHDYDQNVESFRKRYEGLASGEGEIFQHKHCVGYAGQPYFVSEYGGIFWDIGLTEKDDWGYGENPKSIEEFYARLEGLTDVLLENDKMCAFCYTQLTDVFQEKNGIYSFDREVKFDMDRVRKIFTKVAAIEK